MPNYNQAPKLNNKNKPNDKFYYQLPYNVTHQIFNKLGNSSAQLKIMLFLIGSGDGFSIAEKKRFKKD